MSQLSDEEFLLKLPVALKSEPHLLFVNDGAVFKQVMMALNRLPENSPAAESVYQFLASTVTSKMQAAGANNNPIGMMGIIDKVLASEDPRLIAALADGITQAMKAAGENSTAHPDLRHAPVSHTIDYVILRENPVLIAALPAGMTQALTAAGKRSDYRTVYWIMLCVAGAQHVSKEYVKLAAALPLDPIKQALTAAAANDDNVAVRHMRSWLTRTGKPEFIKLANTFQPPASSSKSKPVHRGRQHGGREEH